MDATSVSVLIVDDDEEFAGLLSDFLVDELKGITPRIAQERTYTGGLARVAAGGLDVVLLDYRLGADDGLELLGEVRARGIRTPVIVLTGWSDEAVVVRAMKAGATDYLSKSKLSGGALAASVRHCVAIHAREELQRRAEREILTSEQRFRMVFDEAPIGMALLDAQGNLFRANAAIRAMFGYTEAELVDGGLAECTHPSDRDESRAHDSRLLRGEVASYAIEKRYVARSGATVWARLTASSLRGADGAIELCVKMIENITERKHAEEALRESGHLLEEAQALARIGSWTWTISTGDDLVWSRECYAIFGVPLGTPMTVAAFFACIDPADREAVERARTDAVERGLALDLEHRVPRPDGSVRWIHERAVVERDAAGRPVRLMGTAQDVTQRKESENALRRSEEQLRQSQKMEAVGRLAGGVAHDFNNLLSVILSYTDLALEGLRSADPLRQDLTEIQRAGQRATELTRQLLAFSRQQVLQPRVFDLTEVLGAMQMMLGRLLGEDVELRVILTDATCTVLADPGQVEQVVMNLAVNARDAMPDGGALTIETRSVTVGPDGGRAGRTPGDYVLLAISDSGTGMDAPTRARIFEPFFTTKQQGKGTGLGLATVFGIVQQSGGFLEVTSAPGSGSRFEVYLPRTDEKRVAPGSVGPATLVRGTETILLVEDEDQVRTVACAILRRQGYKVLETANGGEAFLVAQEHRDAIDLLLTDVVMPRMSGRVLSEHLVASRPTMKVLFTSGYTNDAIVHHGVSDADLAFLQKPFTPECLLRKVREVLDAPMGRRPS